MKNTMQIVGITGRSGSGKSRLAAYYASLGYPAVDGDAVSREVMLPGSECVHELTEAFGMGILREDGSVDRRRLAELAFATPGENAKLIAVTHPHIVKRLLEYADDARKRGAELFFVDGAMIVDGPFEPHCDKLITVVAELRLSISRIVLRDNISKTAAMQRLDAQLPEKRLRDAADFVIENNSGQQSLQAQADKVLLALLQKD